MTVDEIRQEVVEQELEEANDDGDYGEREQRGEKRQHQNEGINSGIHHSESTGHGHDTDEDDQDDENPRPTKQRRLSLAPPDMPPTPALEQSSPKPCLARPHSATPSSTTQLEIGDAQSQTDLAHPPTPVKNDHYYAPPSSRSPSDTEESAPVAEYQE